MNASSVYGHVNRCLSEPHTHTHPFNSPLSGTTQVGRYQKGKTNLDFTEATDSEWQWHQLGHMQVCTLLQTDNHASTPPLSILQAGCPSCRPTNSVKALKAFCLSEPLMRISGRTGGVFIATEFNISAPTYFPRIAYKPRHRRHKPQHAWAASENQCVSMNSSW